MNTLKKIEKYEQMKKGIITLTIILVILDTIIGFASPVYRPSASSLLGLGFTRGYRIEYKEISKVILILSLVLAGFSIYYIILNLMNMQKL